MIVTANRLDPGDAETIDSGDFDAAWKGFVWSRGKEGATAISDVLSALVPGQEAKSLAILRGVFLLVVRHKPSARTVVCCDRSVMNLATSTSAALLCAASASWPLSICSRSMVGGTSGKNRAPEPSGKPPLGKAYGITWRNSPRRLMPAGSASISQAESTHVW